MGAAARMLLQALAVAAVNVGADQVFDWGCRSLALGWGRGRTSTAELLARPAAEDDPFIEVLSPGPDRARPLPAAGCPTRSA